MHHSEFGVKMKRNNSFRNILRAHNNLIQLFWLPSFSYIYVAHPLQFVSHNLLRPSRNTSDTLLHYDCHFMKCVANNFCVAKMLFRFAWQFHGITLHLSAKKCYTHLLVNLTRIDLRNHMIKWHWINFHSDFINTRLLRFLYMTKKKTNEFEF